jgi:hypothetical protein
MALTMMPAFSPAPVSPSSSSILAKLTPFSIFANLDNFQMSSATSAASWASPSSFGARVEKSSSIRDSYSTGSSPGSSRFFPARPCRVAFRADRSLPASVFGPVALLSAASFFTSTPSLLMSFSFMPKCLPPQPLWEGRY